MNLLPAIFRRHNRKPASFIPGFGPMGALLLLPLGMYAAGPAHLHDQPTGPPWSSPTCPGRELDRQVAGENSGQDLAPVTIREGVVRLRCAFQQLAGEVSGAGLTITSMVARAPADRLRVVADYLGRDGGAMVALPDDGVPGVESDRARYARVGLVEEYAVSLDGIRQDLVVSAAPSGDGELRVELSVTGARARRVAGGAQLELDQSGRKLGYGQLRVLDAQWRSLVAHLEVVSEHRLAVVVADTGAVYPVRIDPTFSDANWVSLGAGLNGSVAALAVLGTNLYVGGSFTTAGDASASYIARWDGTAWSPLGLGLDGLVTSLAVLGSDLYVGGEFTMAGGISAPAVAKWDGTAWSPLGSGMAGTYPYVLALTVSGSNLYAGGWFTTAGGVAASYVAKWDGNNWSALGSGLNKSVDALAVSGSTLYVAGNFTKAGGKAAAGLAQWNGSAWSALGSGTDGLVYSLAMLGPDLYAGGYFITAGNTMANNVARWDGTAWSALGSGVNSTGLSYVYALAFSGTNLYAGGKFATAGGYPANGLAQWDGSSWSALGSGVNGTVYALAPSGADLYAGGAFTTAGGQASTNIAKARAQVTATGCVIKTISASKGNAKLSFLGSSGLQYDVLRATSLTEPVNWITLTTDRLSAGADGSFTFIDTNAPNGTAYYRSVQR